MRLGIYLVQASNWMSCCMNSPPNTRFSTKVSILTLSSKPALNRDSLLEASPGTKFGEFCKMLSRHVYQGTQIPSRKTGSVCDRIHGGFGLVSEHPHDCGTLGLAELHDTVVAHYPQSLIAQWMTDKCGLSLRGTLLDLVTCSLFKRTWPQRSNPTRSEDTVISSVVHQGYGMIGCATYPLRSSKSQTLFFALGGSTYTPTSLPYSVSSMRFCAVCCEIPALCESSRACCALSHIGLSPLSATLPLVPSRWSSCPTTKVSLAWATVIVPSSKTLKHNAASRA